MAGAPLSCFRQPVQDPMRSKRFICSHRHARGPTQDPVGSCKAHIEATCRRRKVDYPGASRKHREGRYGSRTRDSDAGNKRIAGGLETFPRLRIRLAQQQGQRK